MPRAATLLLLSSLIALLVGFAVAGLSLVFPGDHPGAAGLLLGGLVTVAVGVHGAIVWVGLSAASHGGARGAARWIAEADAHAEAERWDYALTYYEEALRAGADPEEVVPRLAMVDALRAGRA